METPNPQVEEQPTQVQETVSSSPVTEPQLTEQELHWKSERDLFTQRMREQDAEIATLKNQQQAPIQQQNKQIKDDSNKSEYWENPVKVIREVIAEEQQTQIKPLVDYVQQQRNEQAYQSLKQTVRNHPQFPYFNQVESAIDQMIYGFVNQGGQVNVGVIQQAYVNAVGIAFNSGQLSLPTQVEKPRVIPPSIPSSAPNVPGRGEPDTTNYDAQLTETERKIARLNGMTAKEFLDEKNNNIMKVTSHKAGK